MFISDRDKGIEENYPWTIECFLEDLFLGGQSSIILVNRRLSVKFLPDISFLPLIKWKEIGSGRDKFNR